MAISIEDAIRAAGVSDDDAANAMRFAGYLGNSGLASRTRLYLNEQPNEYIEVATADLMATIDLAGENSPLVLILIRPEKLIQHSAVVSETIQADFLAGDIAQRNLQDNRLLWASGSGPEEFIRRPTHACGSLWHCVRTDPAADQMRR